MAVYTQLEFGEIEALIAPLGLGRLIAAHGVAAGVENTTYFLDVASADPNRPQSYVLTIAEALTRSDLEFVTGLTHYLHNHGLPVPAPLFPGNHFVASSAVLCTHDKPALLIPKIADTHPLAPTPNLCGQVGSILAKLHSATLTFECYHESPRSLTWVFDTARAVLPLLSKPDQDLLKQELDSATKFASTNKNLPQAIIHGDLFRDNVLVSNGAVTALIDFFSAGAGYLLLDLAIVVNDWCFDEQGSLNRDNYEALVNSYCAFRKPSRAEVDSWGQILRLAALRFWVSRLNEQLLANTFAPAGRGKSPDLYRQHILMHRNTPLKLPLSLR